MNCYPPDWKAISDRVCAEAGRCVRCGHPYKKRAHGNGQWSPCDDKCTHKGPIRLQRRKEWVNIVSNATAGELVKAGEIIEAEWRILTVHHFDGDKANCEWWNLLPLCQRDHLQIQGRVDPNIPYFLEHSEWAKPYIAGFYSAKYEGKLITRGEAVARMDELLAHERRA